MYYIFCSFVASMGSNYRGEIVSRSLGLLLVFLLHVVSVESMFRRTCFQDDIMLCSLVVYTTCAFKILKALLKKIAFRRSHLVW